MFARLGGGRRFALGRDDIAPLQVRGEAVHKAGANDGMPLKLLRQSPREDPALERVDRRCGGLDDCVFVLGQAERRHGRLRAGARHDGAARAATSRGLTDGAARFSAACVGE